MRTLLAPMPHHAVTAGLDSASMSRARGIFQLSKQHLETLQLLGVDFVPLPRVAAEPGAPIQASTTFEMKPQLDHADGDRKLKLLEELRARHDSDCVHCTNA